MNSKRLIIIVSVVAVAAMLLYLLWPAKTEEIVAKTIPATPTPIPATATPVPSGPTTSDQGQPGTSYYHLVALADSGPEGKKKALEEAYHAPIDFWGKVVDQDGKPIEGADAKFTINTDPDPYGNLPTVHVQSDANGLFSLTEKKGLSLSIWVSKDGYYSTPEKSGIMLNYSLKGGENQSFPTPDNPTVFVLKKKGQAANLIHKHIRIPIPKNGTPVEISLAEGKVVGAGQGDLKIEDWTADHGKNVANPFDWKCRVTVVGGGLQNRNGTLAFEAPADGYQPQEEVNMPATTPRWLDTMDRNYFLQISGGRYVRMTFAMINSGDHFASLDYYLNPQAGDRNLESAK